MGAAGVITVVAAVLMMAALARAPAPDLVTNGRFLTAHNNARRAVGVPALIWSNFLQKGAEAYADRVGCTVTAPGYSGVNLYLTDVPVGFIEAMTYWLSEKTFYRYSSNSCTTSHFCGHYTQIVWKTTKYVGCAYYLCGNGGRFVACLYSPSGNIPGQRPY